MRQVQLGKSDLQVSASGLGCMGMSDFYGPRDDQQNLTTLARAVDLGVNFWDTSDMYGQGKNEEGLQRTVFPARCASRSEALLAFQL